MKINLMRNNISFRLNLSRVSTVSVILLFSAVSFIPISCTEKSLQSAVNFASPYSTLLEGKIEEGRVLAPAGASGEILKAQIKSQLKFATGQLATDYSGIEHDSIVSGFNATPIGIDAPSGLSIYRYKASFSVAMESGLWEKNDTKALTLILPLRTDADGLAKFWDTYGKKCVAKKIGVNGIQPDTEATKETFWYFYRVNDCVLSETPATAAEFDGVYRTLAKLKSSDANTVQKSPEYGRIWDDGRFVATVVITYVGDILGSEGGTQAFVGYLKRFVSAFGSPIHSSNLSESWQEIVTKPSFHPEQHLTFAGPLGNVELNLFLINTVSSPLIVESSLPQNFEKSLAESVKNSDFVSYNGHSGFGQSSLLFAEKLKNSLSPGKYTVVQLNGCNTWVYAGDALMKKSMEINNQQKNNLDLILNILPSPIHAIESNSDMLMAMTSGFPTYEEILNAGDKSMRPVVVYENDNEWKSVVP